MAQENESRWQAAVQELETLRREKEDESRRTDEAQRVHIHLARLWVCESIDGLEVVDELPWSLRAVPITGIRFPILQIAKRRRPIG